MNPKRRKLDTSISPAIPPTETSDVLSSNPKTILKSLSTFKEKLATRKDVLSFIEKSRTVFRSLVGLMQRSASEVLVARQVKFLNNIF
uniref:Uncharacterized protein n=1 Tax=Ditylenchus dipsaci TaxID=166011 RepID=A0A915DEF7_9BILA